VAWPSTAAGAVVTWAAAGVLFAAVSGTRCVLQEYGLFRQHFVLGFEYYGGFGEEVALLSGSQVIGQALVEGHEHAHRGGADG